MNEIEFFRNYYASPEINVDDIKIIKEMKNKALVEYIKFKEYLEKNKETEHLNFSKTEEILNIYFDYITRNLNEIQKKELKEQILKNLH